MKTISLGRLKPMVVSTPHEEHRHPDYESDEADNEVCLECHDAECAYDNHAERVDDEDGDRAETEHNAESDNDAACEEDAKVAEVISQVFLDESGPDRNKVIVVGVRVDACGVRICRAVRVVQDDVDASRAAVRAGVGIGINFCDVIDFDIHAALSGQTTRVVPGVSDGLCSAIIGDESADVPENVVALIVVRPEINDEVPGVACYLFWRRAEEERASLVIDAPFVVSVDELDPEDAFAAVTTLAHLDNFVAVAIDEVAEEFDGSVF